MDRGLELTRSGEIRQGRRPDKRTREIVGELVDARPGDVAQIELEEREQDGLGYRRFLERVRTAKKILQMRATTVRGATIDGHCYACVVVRER